MSSDPSKPLVFNAKVIDGTPAISKGNYSAELTATGLILKSKGKLVAEFGTKSVARQLPSNKVQIETSQGPLTIQVSKLNGYVDLIAEAIVRCLSGAQVDLTPGIYNAPAWLLILAGLPIVLIPIGGMIGGLIGGASAGANLYIAKQRAWPIVARVLAVLSLFVAAIVTYVGLSVMLVLLTAQRPITSVPLPAQPIAAPSVKKVEPKPEVVIHKTLADFQKLGVVRVDVENMNATCAHRMMERDSVLVGHRDGMLRKFSLASSQNGWNTIAKIPFEVTRLDPLTSDYFIVRSKESTYLLTPAGKLLEFPWKWICLPSSTILFAVAPDQMLTGMLNFGTIEKSAVASTNGLDGGAIATFPIEAIESKDGPPIVVEPPADYDYQALSVAGRTPITLGFSNGRAALRVSNEWIIENTRDKKVTCFGDDSGIGFEDGIVDTGLVDTELRFRQCGDQSIERISSYQVWTIALNSEGEAWSFIRQSKDPPKRVLSDDSIGPIRAVIQLDSAIAIVGEEKIAFRKQLDIKAP